MNIHGIQDSTDSCYTELNGKCENVKQSCEHGRIWALQAAGSQTI
jgi:hypothetical protein